MIIRRTLKSPVQTRGQLPETVAQALTWDKVKSQVLRLGLCESCAAQYAWGIQIGFAHSRPPCDGCASIVERGGRIRPNGWRTLHKVRGTGWAGATP